VNFLLNIRPYALLLLTVLAAQTLCLASDVRLLDGLFLEYQLERYGVAALHWWFSPFSMEPWVWLLSPLAGSSHAGVVMRIAEVLSVAVLSWSVYFIASKHTSLGKDESWCLAALAGVHPVYAGSVQSITVIYLLPTGIFFVAWAAHIHLSLTRRNRLIYDALCLTALCLAFVHNSLLVVNYACLALLFALTYQRDLPRDLRQFGRQLLTFLRNQWLFAIAPVLFYVARAQLFPPRGAHNQLISSQITVAKTFLSLFKVGVIDPLISSVGMTAMLLAAVSLFLYLVRARRDDGQRGITVAVFMMGLLFVAAAIYPYAAVGKAAPYESLFSRYTIQCGTGLGLLILAGVRSLGPASAHLRTTILGAFIAAFSLATVDLQAMWLARWAKDRAVIHHFSRIPPPPEGTTFVWRDKFPVGDEVYRYFELGYFMRSAWGKEAWLAFDSRQLSKSLDLTGIVAQSFVYGRNAEYAQADFVDSGCRGEITVEPGEIIENPSKNAVFDHRFVARRYLLGYLFNKAQLNDLLDDLVRVNISPINCDGAKKAP
jgi:hypothetical protein